jgi:predicted NAD/FAD-binding protein
MKVAVIGSGVSGIGATWALNEYSAHEVHLYESNDYIGGHTHTVPFRKGDKSTNVDTGFIVRAHLPMSLHPYPGAAEFSELSGC